VFVKVVDLDVMPTSIFLNDDDDVDELPAPMIPCLVCLFMFVYVMFSGRSNDVDEDLPSAYLSCVIKLRRKDSVRNVRFRNKPVCRSTC